MHINYTFIIRNITIYHRSYIYIYKPQESPCNSSCCYFMVHNLSFNGLFLGTPGDQWSGGDRRGSWKAEVH